MRQTSISTDPPVYFSGTNGDTESVTEDNEPPAVDGETTNTSGAVRKASLQAPQPAHGRNRHVSMQSNGDTTTSLEHDTNNSLTHDARKFDTTNLRTFGRNTHEAIPHMDFYRQTTSASASHRPTLEQLHEEKVIFEVSSVRVLKLV